VSIQVAFRAFNYAYDLKEIVHVIKDFDVKLAEVLHTIYKVLCEC